MNTSPENTNEIRDPFTEEVRAIRKVIEEDPAYVNMTEEELKNRARAVVEQRSAVMAVQDPVIARYYSSLDYKSRIK